MILQITYLVLAVLGFALPYSQLISFFAAHGFDLSLFWSQLFTNRISTDFAFDLLVSSIVFGFFVFQEGNKRQMKFLWLYILLNWVIGLSFALPLFLFIRLRKLNNLAASDSIAEFKGEAV